MNTEIDQRAFALGSLSAFAEMVRVGVKTLALSAALTPEEMDSLVADAERIAREEGVLLYREPDLIVTDLFPAGVAAGQTRVADLQGRDTAGIPGPEKKEVRTGGFRFLCG